MKSKERYIWMAAGAVLITCFALVAVAPTLLAQSNSSKSDEYLRSIREVFRYIEENYVEEVDPRQLLEGAMKGMFDTLDDPYSYYLTADGMSSLSEITVGEFGGVGIVISKQTRADAGDDEPRYIEVVSPIEDTPAFLAGILSGDLITNIGDESTEDLTIDDVVKRIRGEPGTPVTFTIQRDGRISFDVTVTRDVIEVPTVKQAMIDDTIGYLRIIEFTPFSDDRIRDALEYFELEGYKALIIDVRNNPGGLLKSVVDIADLFLSGDTIVSTRSRIPADNKIFNAKTRVETPLSYPIVVLINKGSASASEILAGALRDNNRASLVGETTFGKGSVQDVRSFSEGGIRLTTSRYFTPSGINIDKIGIDPDVVVAEDPFDEEEQASMLRLSEERTMAEFVEANPNPNEDELAAFIEDLRGDGIVLEERILRRLIRNQMNRVNNTNPVFDLDYDLALREAVKIIRNGTGQTTSR